jgi:hypothetical protein
MTIDQALALSGRLMDDHMEASVISLRRDGAIDDDSERVLRCRYLAWRTEQLAKMEAQLRNWASDGAAIATTDLPDFAGLITDNGNDTLH